MRVAIISDIHGNMQALNAVLDDIKNENCDKIFCLGDLAMAGPEPTKAILTIKGLLEEGKLELIQGNTDEMIANYEQFADKVKAAYPIMGAALENDVKIIPEDLQKFLKDLPPQKQMTIEGFNVLLVHGSPRRNDENILPNMPEDEIEQILEGVNADIIFCGHTHMPCEYKTENDQIIVNDGSVGRPFTENPQACYVVADFIEGKFEFMHKFLDYDRETAAKILSKRDIDGAEKLAQILIMPKTRHI